LLLLDENPNGKFRRRLSSHVSLTDIHTGHAGTGEQIPFKTLLGLNELLNFWHNQPRFIAPTPWSKQHALS
jgi:hypothetical protein